MLSHAKEHQRKPTKAKESYVKSRNISEHKRMARNTKNYHLKLRNVKYNQATARDVKERNAKKLWLLIRKVKESL